jgi:hypothetical protein
MGSAKDLVAPWGGDKRLGDRVLTWVKNTLAGRTATCGPDTVKHEVSANDSCPYVQNVRTHDALLTNILNVSIFLDLSRSPSTIPSKSLARVGLSTRVALSSSILTFSSSLAALLRQWIA